MKKIICLIALTFIANLINAQSARDYEKTMYGRNPKAGHYVSMRGFKMYYEVYGKGNPLLIIHGNDGSIINFLYNIPYFSKKYKVIIADSRAQGKSIDNSDSLSYEMMADDLNALLESLHVDSCFVIGKSDGGINGLLLAIRHPDKVKKLAVTGANLWPDTSAIDPFIYHWVNHYNDSLSRLNQTPKVKNERKLFNLMINEPNITLQQLHTIKCPTLVIGGDHDVIKPVHTMLIAQSISKSYLWILPNSGHSTSTIYHDIFNKTVDNFFTTPYRVIDGEGRFD